MSRFSQDVTIIEARARTPLGRARDLFRFRHFYPFLFREIAIRKFRRMFLGLWWLLLRPLLPAVAAAFTFTFVIPMPSYGLPYLIFFLSGMTAWSAFQSVVSFMPRTMLWMQGIMRKTYFPRMLVPLASFGPPLVDLAINLAFLGLALLYYWWRDGVLHMQTGPALLLFPVALAMAFAFAFAIGMFLSVVVLFLRDVRFTIGYISQVLMLLTPVLYPITIFPPAYHWLVYVLNPMAAIVETSRWALTGQGVFSATWLGVSALVIAILNGLSVLFFVRTEDVVADAL